MPMLTWTWHMSLHYSCKSGFGIGLIKLYTFTIPFSYLLLPRNYLTLSFHTSSFINSCNHDGDFLRSLSLRWSSSWIWVLIFTQIALLLVGSFMSLMSEPIWIPQPLCFSISMQKSSDSDNLWSVHWTGLLRLRRSSQPYDKPGTWANLPYFK